jgi:hypothetical protein
MEEGSQQEFIKFVGDSIIIKGASGHPGFDGCAPPIHLQAASCKAQDPKIIIILPLLPRNEASSWRAPPPADPPALLLLLLLLLGSGASIS